MIVIELAVAAAIWTPLTVAVCKWIADAWWNLLWWQSRHWQLLTSLKGLAVEFPCMNPWKVWVNLLVNDERSYPATEWNPSDRWHGVTIFKTQMHLMLLSSLVSFISAIDSHIFRSWLCGVAQDSGWSGVEELVSCGWVVFFPLKRQTG